MASAENIEEGKRAVDEIDAESAVTNQFRTAPVVDEEGVWNVVTENLFAEMIVPAGKLILVRFLSCCGGFTDRDGDDSRKMNEEEDEIDERNDDQKIEGVG